MNDFLQPLVTAVGKIKAKNVHAFKDQLPDRLCIFTGRSRRGDNARLNQAMVTRFGCCSRGHHLLL
jgi:hypothetical protein